MEPGRAVPSSHSSQIFLLATHTSHAAPPLVQAGSAYTHVRRRRAISHARSLEREAPVALPAEELGKVFLANRA